MSDVPVSAKRTAPFVRAKAFVLIDCSCRECRQSFASSWPLREDRGIRERHVVERLKMMSRPLSAAVAHFARFGFVRVRRTQK